MQCRIVIPRWVIVAAVAVVLVGCATTLRMAADEPGVSERVTELSPGAKAAGDAVVAVTQQTAAELKNAGAEGAAMWAGLLASLLGNLWLGVRNIQIKRRVPGAVPPIPPLSSS